MSEVMDEEMDRGLYAVVDIESSGSDETNLTLESAVDQLMLRLGYYWSVRRKGSRMQLAISGGKSQGQLPRNTHEVFSDEGNDAVARTAVLRQVAEGRMAFPGSVAIVSMSHYRQKAARAYECGSMRITNELWERYCRDDHEYRNHRW